MISVRGQSRCMHLDFGVKAKLNSRHRNEFTYTEPSKERAAAPADSRHRKMRGFQGKSAVFQGKSAITKVGIRNTVRETSLETLLYFSSAIYLN